jgi:hypothetical protein
VVRVAGVGLSGGRGVGGDQTFPLAPLAGFVASLERQVDAMDTAGNPYAGLAVEHGLAVHRASLAWAEQAITRLAQSPRTQGRGGLD